MVQSLVRRKPAVAGACGTAKRSRMREPTPSLKRTTKCAPASSRVLRTSKPWTTKYLECAHWAFDLGPWKTSLYQLVNFYEYKSTEPFIHLPSLKRGTSRAQVQTIESSTTRPAGGR